MELQPTIVPLLVVALTLPSCTLIPLILYNLHALRRIDNRLNEIQTQMARLPCQ